MKKIMMSAAAASALMLGGCGDKAPVAEATATAEASAEATADSGDAATATDAGDETTSGGIKPQP
ncbi:hypothetical protein [Novosphingobium sp.]|uniref:hypothetical protein n=1 Tax=Novosphingobium sp. TaxID=1874826 RepID=UPI00286BD2DE|nr:hypothetical protein [Novosphingobium sp.]